MSKENFNQAIGFTIEHEGYRSSDPFGKLTVFGVAAKFHPVMVARLDKMTKEDALVAATEFYYTEYWLPAHCDELPMRTSIVMFDCAVNPGIGRAIQFLQRAVNVPDDGVFGKVTKKATENYSDMHLVLKMVDERRKYYQQKVMENPAKTIYLKGWLNRCDALETYVREI